MLSEATMIVLGIKLGNMGKSESKVLVPVCEKRIEKIACMNR